MSSNFSGGERAVRRKTAENGYDIRIARDDPGMQERIPMHGIGFTQLPIQAVRGGHDIRLHELTQTDVGIHGFFRTSAAR